ncbi:T6SS effector BTH_I2691 family protein [Vogesella alkaliphila]|uniref:Toxin VasX N-terminal region domain-containing protein n=1 Tax=Vogesella alkaliphila TaxID=1193621 RepID=A0ABQ2YWR0_9NEIS|nr:T6SS effector BTH_I2691 family protein [Vogesella alkaliphila]GGX94884.1 hypothetical protein GCM10011290_23280 [Vogesella alkaliphila]
MSEPTPCKNKFCGKQGLLLLPLRYAVVASDAGHAEFAELSGNLGQGVADKKLGAAAYTVRMLRHGYLYVMAKRKGKLKWDSAWAVNSQGYIARISLGEAVSPPVFSCNPETHGVNASLISVEKAEDVSELKVLFLPDPLTKAALLKIETDSKLHGMLQSFQAKAVAQTHAMQPAELSATVAEFRSLKGDGRKLAPRFNGHLHPFFGQDVSLVKNQPYPYTGRLQNLQTELLNKKGLAIVLHDPLGIVQELNNWRSASINRLSKLMESSTPFYGTYRNEQLMAIIAAVDNAEQLIKQGAISQREPKLGVSLEDLATEAKKHPYSMPDLRGTPPDAIYKNRAEYERKRAEWRKQNAKRIGDAAWGKYAKRLQPKAMYQGVAQGFQLVAQACDALNEQRARDQLQWLNDALLHNTLALYDDNHLESGVASAGQTGMCINGFNSCLSGQAWLNQQLDASRLKPATLLLNSMLLNQKKAMEEFVAAGGLSGGIADAAGKWQEALKGVSDLWAKLNDLANAIAHGAQNSGIVSVSHLGGISMLLVQGGHALLANLPGGKFIDGQIARSNVLHALLKLSLGKILNKDLEAAYPSPQAFNSKTYAVSKAMRNQVNKLLTDASKGNDFNGLRFGAVVAVLEMANLLLKSNSLKESPGQKAVWELTAASLGMGAVLLELTGGICERMAKSGNHALVGNGHVGLGALKLSAGALGAVGGIIGGLVDFDSATDEMAKAGGRRTSLSRAYQLRGIVSISGALVGAGIAIGAAGPFFEWLLVRSKGEFAKVILTAATEVSAFLATERIALLLLRGARLFTVAGIGLTIAIWMFSDDALESWCDKSCLRKDRSTAGFGRAKEEMAALDAAVLEVS